MLDTRTGEIGAILGFLADELDVPENLYAEMVRKYEHLSSWVKEDNAERFHTDSEIYPQGSTKLGTMIHPVKKDCEYDVDLVYRRELSKKSVTQEELVEQTGEQLRRYIADLRKEGEDVPELVRRRRCWALNYKGRFHMDVLPSIPDNEAATYTVRSLDAAILITDRELREWQHSNPKGYAEWFNDRERRVLRERRGVMAKAANVEIESIPEERVRTPLRRVIQVLKRHRDIRYEGNPDDKPISIIITTLAAVVYANQTDLFDALISAVRDMPKGVQTRNGEWWIPNPVNPRENFADKWNEEPRKATLFFQWLSQVEADLTAAQQQVGGIHWVGESLAPVFGREVVQKSIERFGRDMDAAQQRGALKMATKTGMLGTAGSVVPKNTWYGEE
jgi:hypothetical protein